MAFDKDPDSTLDYFFDWTEWLGPTDTIINHSIDIVPLLGVELDSSSVSQDGKQVVVWLVGGDENTAVDVTCHIVTQEGREDDRTMSIWVKER
jgi:hypothetical protein